MIINGTRFGSLDVDEKNLLTVTGGLCGFERLEQFALLTPPEMEPYAWLQSVEDPAVAFVVVDTAVVCPELSVAITPAEALLLDCPVSGETVVMAVVTVPPGQPHAATANLIAPLVINPANRRACQVIFDASPYTTRHPLFP